MPSGGQSRGMVWRKPRSGGALQAVTTPLDCAPGGTRGLVLVGYVYCGNGTDLHRLPN